MIAMLPAFYAFFVGACVGSFLNVCVSRLPAGLSVISPRSRCPHCERPIPATENIPIFGWLLLRGRCRGCGQPISPEYPLVELVTALGWLVALLQYGPTLTALRVAVFGTLLLGIALTDARHYVIPDGFTLFGLIWVIVTNAAGVFFTGESPFAAPLAALTGACAGAGAIAITGWLGELALKKEAMGFGDVTLMAFAGAALGPERALITVFLGAAVGAVFFLVVVLPIGMIRSRRRGEKFEAPLVPFGVFLAPAAFIALIWGHPLIAWYARISGL